MARRLGWLGPAIVLVGVIAAAVGVWVMIRMKPAPGVVIDEIEIENGGKLVIRAEANGSRSFVELHERGELRWQALVPTYAGRPGTPAIAWNDRAVSVRVIRDGKAEIFALSRRDASKLGGIHLATDKGPVTSEPSGPLTLHDRVRSYEIVAGTGWRRLIAIDLNLGKVLWERDLPPGPVENAGVDGGLVWIEQGAKKRFFAVFTGKENRSRELVGPPPSDGVPPAWPTAPGSDDLAPDQSRKPL